MTAPRKKTKRRRMLLVAAAAFLVFAVGGWFWLNSFIKSKVESQLVAAGFDSCQVSSVQVGLGGVEAKGISLANDSVSIDVNRVSVNQSIFKLASGTEPADSVTVSGVEVTVDFDSLDGDSNFTFADLDLDRIELPVKKIEASDLRIKLHDADGAVEIEIVDSIVEVDESSFVLDGQAKLLEGEFEIHGTINRKTNDLKATFNGDQVHLVDQQWQKWPGIPPSVLRHLGADSVFDVVGSVDGNLKTGVSYLAEVETKDAKLYIPKFNLPIAVHSADVRIQDGLVTYRNVVAGLGDSDIVNGTGTTSIDGFPCRSNFQGDFTDVDVADLRKLVKGIPAKVVGIATGKVVGSVDVNQELETTLRIDAQGQTNQASFGEIVASSGTVDVQIQPLIITQFGKTVDLQGAVSVNATTTDQDVDGILATFDLQELDRQFEFEMLGSGDVELVIPLNSAADLRTWKLEIDSKASTGSIGAMQLQDLKIKSFLDQGNLVFKPATAKLTLDSAVGAESRVNASVVWPLPNAAADSIRKTGVVEVSGVSVPPAEGLKFFDLQMKNAGVDYAFDSEIQSLAKSDIKGGVSFKSRIELPASVDRPIKSWDVTASVYDSSLNLAGENLNGLRTELTISEGVLKVENLNGVVDSGGKLDALASMNLETSRIVDGQMQAIKFPAAWLASLIIRMDSSGEFVRRTGLNSDNVAESLSGFFDAVVRVEPEQNNRILWSATSGALSVYGKKFESVVASGKYEEVFDIKRIKANLPGGGLAQLEGDWIARLDEGNFDLKWKGASLASLFKGQIDLPDSVDSYSDGQLKISLKDSRPVISGEIDLIEPKAFGGTLNDHRFKIETVEDRFVIRNDPGYRNEISIEGSVASKSPYAFQLNGATKAMSLSTSLYDELSGSVTSKFKLGGNVAQPNFRSVGKAKFQDLRFDQARLSAINASWDFDSRRQEKQGLTIDGFGGRMRLASGKGAKDDLFFDVDEIELEELAAFRTLPIELAGAVSGRIKVADWRSPSSRSIVAQATSPLVRVGPARLPRVIGNARLSKGGTALEYQLESQLIDGKLECSGKTKFDAKRSVFTSTFPVKVRLVNGRLNRLAELLSVTPIEALRRLQGRVSLAMDWEVTPGEYPDGDGVVVLEDCKYKGRLLSRKIFSDVLLEDGIMRLKRIDADLQQGQIAGRATIPLVGSATGRYELDIRNFSLPRMLHVLVDDPIEADGLVNAKISGRTGQTITGAGTLGLSRAGLFGVANQSMKVPIRFRVRPAQQQARIEIPNTRFRAFRGTVDGKATLDIGTSLKLDSNLELSNIDSKTLVRSFTGYDKPGNGKLSGKLKVSSGNIRTEKDLVGSFRGKLDQSNALAYPLFDQLGRFLGNNLSLRNDQFNSDTIELTLSKGRVNVKQFRLQSSLVSLVVTGDAWLSGKLDIEVAARVERLNQPTLLDQLAGSPISRLAGPQAAFFAQAAEFLSERIVFLDVTGTAKRPQIRVNPGKQLKEEAIRYFLRGSQILPNGNVQNN